MRYGVHYSTSGPYEHEDHMRCTFCGQELKPNTKTCFRCGYDSPFHCLPYYQANDTASIASYIETCEITWERKAVGLVARIFFRAEVDGPNGSYVYATSEPAPDKYMTYTPEGTLQSYRIPANTAEAIEVFNQPIRELEADGWVYKSRGLGWWNVRYQHTLEPESKPEQPRQAPNDTRRIDQDWREVQ